MADDLKKAYRTILDDHFPPRMEIAFVEGEKRSVLAYEKITWQNANWLLGLGLE